MLIQALNNLLSGLKVSLFLKFRKEDFHVSQKQLWFVVFLTLTITFFEDLANTKSPRNFSIYALEFSSLYFMMIFFGAFVASLILKHGQLQLSLPIIILNSVIFPMYVIDNGIDIINPEWMKNLKAYNLYTRLFQIWFFLIIFRSVLALTNLQIIRQIVSTLLLMFLIYFPSKFVNPYPPRFWYKDYNEQEEILEEKISAEDILQKQHVMLEKALKSIKPTTDSTDFYLISFGSYGWQDVFMKEALFAKEVFDKKLKTIGRSIALINNKKTIDTYPLASVTNLKHGIDGLAKKADTKEDILLLFLTSHGDKDSSLSMYFDYVPLNSLDSKKLKELLENSSFKWKVIIISACFSGTFIEPLKNENTIIITASSKDRNSFGCSDERELTFFGEAYLKEAMSQTNSLIEAFHIAKDIVRKMEEREKYANPSEPQIFIGKEIENHLAIK